MHSYLDVLLEDLDYTVDSEIPSRGPALHERRTRPCDKGIMLVVLRRHGLARGGAMTSGFRCAG
jgi:hypothetical protein